MNQSSISNPQSQLNKSPVCDSSQKPQRTAVALLHRGYWPVVLHPLGSRIPSRAEPSKGKEPIVDAWGLNRPTEDDLRHLYDSYPEAGVGIRLGPEGGLIDIEVDGPEGEASFLRLCGGEVVETLGWSSRRGQHRLFRWDDRLAALGVIKTELAQLPGLEIRTGLEGKQAQSACPPTLGEDGVPRVWCGPRTIAHLPESAIQFILDAVAEKRTEPPQDSPTKRNGHPNGSPAEAWYRKALEGEAGKVAIASVGGRNNTLLASARTLGGRLHPEYLTEADVVRELTRAAKLAGLPDGEIADTLKRGLEYGKAQPLPGPEEAKPKRGRPRKEREPDPEEQRETIEVTDRFDLLVDDTRKVLRRIDGLYQREGMLVNVIREDSDEIQITPGTTIRHAAGAPRISPLRSPLLCEQVHRVADFGKWRKDKNGELCWSPSTPPDRLWENLLTRGEGLGVPVIKGITECPIIRDDGKLWNTIGYDPITRYFLTSRLPTKHVPSNPTRDDARAAAQKLFEPLAQFPFDGEHQKAVWLAGLLTVLARAAIDGPVPGIAITSNRAGTGKGKLVDAIGLIATGRPVPCATYPASSEEAAKVKLALAIGGSSLIHFDNLENGSSYGNGPIDSAITNPIASGRVLGLSRWIEGAVIVCAWFLSGNALSPMKDAYRRWLICHLKTALEEPEYRKDLKIDDLTAHILAKRHELLAAALTILVAHARAGRPEIIDSDGIKAAKMGSFERWDAIIRAAVWFSTGWDCTKTCRQAAKESPERMKIIALLTAWRSLPGGDSLGITVAEAIAEAEENPAIRDALMAYSKSDKLPTTNRMGQVLRTLDSVAIEGMKLEKVDDRLNKEAKVRTAFPWRVVHAC